MIGKLLIVILVAVAAHIIRVIISSDVGKEVLNHAPGKCHLVPGIENGSEDMILLDGGIAIITSGHRDPDVKHLPCYKDVQGFIGMFDMNKPDGAVVPLHIVGDIDTDDLVPHGITYWGPNDQGEYTIMFVNHPTKLDHDTVEIVSFNPKMPQLIHKKTITNTLFGFVNNIVAVSEDTFYATNIFYHHSFWGIRLEKLLMLKWGQVMYYDGSDVSVVQDGYAASNGLARSPDNKYIYLAEAGAKSVHVYQRGNDNSLILKEKVAVHTLPDNIEVSRDTGDLWIGCHPIIWKLHRHLDDTSQPAPSQVIRLQVKDGHVTSVQDVYSDDGHRLWGSSAALRYKNGLLIGTVVHKMAYCQLDNLYM